MNNKTMRVLAALAMMACVLAARAAVTIDLPELGNPIAGTLPGTASVGPDGSSQYHVDLPMPPGTAGLLPQIGLHYSSKAPETVAGVGWSVTGLSEITRCPSTRVPDGAGRAVALDAQDQYCLDGQRLMLVSGTLGASAEFRTQVETFSRIKSFAGMTAAGPDHWTVETKSGLVQTYGGSGNATATTVGGTGAVINVSWSLARSADRYGNYVLYEYEADASLEHFISRIRYTGNDAAGIAPYVSVTFDYEARPAGNAYVGYFAGALVTRPNRLHAILTRTGTDATGAGGALAHIWRLGYATSAASARSVVTSLGDCDGANNCLAPTNLTWTTRDPAANVFQAPGSGVWSGGPTNIALVPDNVQGYGTLDQQFQAAVLPIDFNGDGRNDLLYSSGNGSWQLCTNTGGAFPCKTQTGMPAIASKSFVPGDFNGDGKTDVFVPPPGTSTVGWICLSSGTSFSCSNVTVVAAPANWNPNYFFAGDLNGDGYDDLMVIGNAEAARPSYLCMSNGTTLGTCANIGLSNGLVDNDDSIDDGTTRLMRLSADFNNDGRIDVLEWQGMATGSEGPTNRDATQFTIRFGADNGFLAGAGFGTLKPEYRPMQGYTLLGDTNGDGYPDFTWSGDGVVGSATNGTSVSYHTNCLTSGAAPHTCARVQLDKADPRGGLLDVGDYDGTGLAVARDGAGMHRIAPDGTPSAIEPWSTGVNVTCANGVAMSADVDGDGLPDGVCYDTVAMTWTVTLAGGKSYPDLLQTVTDGNGLAATFTYKPMTDATVYTNGTGTVFPRRDVHGGEPLVSKLSVDAASGMTAGATLETTYTYSGLRTDVLSRMPLGFATLRATDVATGVTTATTYSQAFPTIGMPTLVTSSASVGGVVRTLSTRTDTLASFSSSQSSAQSSYPYVRQSVTTGYDLDGTCLPGHVSYVGTGVGQTDGIDDAGEVTAQTENFTERDGSGFGTCTSASVFATKTANTYVAGDWTNWIIGRLQDTQITRGAPGASNVVREVAFGYDAKGFLQTQTTQPGTASLQLAVTYTRDPNTGVITRQTQAWTDPLTGAAVSRDSLRMTFTDPAWRYPSSIYDALGHRKDLTYDASTGEVRSQLDVDNGITTTWTYDGFGRKIREHRQDATYTTWAYVTCTSTCGYGATAKSITVMQEFADVNGGEQTVMPQERFYDAHGRKVMTRTWDYTQAPVLQDWVYDANGRLLKVSNPQTWADRGNGNFGWTTYGNFDLLGRARQVSTTNATNSGADVSTIAYSSLQTTRTDANGHSRVELLNGLGKIKQVTDAQNHSTSYAYDPFGNLRSTTDTLGNVNSIVLDALGRKTRQVDLDLGTWNYVVDPAGRVRRQTDAKGQVTTMTYDLLDRMTERLEPDLDSHWVYDTAAKGVGRLAEAYTGTPTAKDYRRTVAYDSVGREHAVVTTLDWDYTTLETYNTYGQPSNIAHNRNVIGQTTGGAQVSYDLAYNNQGDVTQVKRGSMLLWTLSGQDAQGRTVSESLNGGVTQRRHGYNPYTLRLESIGAGPGDGNGGVNPTLQNDGYGYDAVGNLSRRNWLASPGNLLGETFEHDEVNRLHTAQVDGLGLKTFTYNSIGNIATKSDVGTYAYPTANTVRPHMLTGITGTVAGLTNPAFGYDANGNTTSGLNRQYGWSAANLPSTIDRLTAGGPASAVERDEFLYGPERQRTRESVRQMSGTTPGAVQHTIYSAAGIDKEIDAVAGTTKIRTYLPLGLGYTEESFTGTNVAATSAATPAERFFYKDHLGSLEAVSDALGTVLQHFAYDAWGRRRQLTGADNAWTTLGSGALANAQDHTGFTDQEQLDDFGLVHLNGRVYDPMTGRMTSADPTIPDAYDPQSLNRASYVRNSPLVYTDPTGFEDQAPQYVNSSTPGCSPTNRCYTGVTQAVSPANLVRAVGAKSNGIKVNVIYSYRNNGSAIIHHENIGSLIIDSLISGGDMGVDAALSRDEQDLLSGKISLDEFNARLKARAIGGTAGLVLGGTTVLATGPTLAVSAVEAEGAVGLVETAGTTVRLSRVTLNKINGDNFRDEIAALFEGAGYSVRTEVYKWTLFGKRFIDIEVSKAGIVLGGIETKFGGAAYNAAQQAKDAWLYMITRYPVNVIRSGE